ncbi:Rieske 2Fe-2S domain-containing protein [Ramlibacter sp.]|uniref:Rieske (2Fe-2S) protein n=1 Tax=Ramlibacter sp. TaxID=1917967 RepID=UPI001794A9AE|nr:Rieske 2Fe-2S domain-containing protein [Ramlibacter sp.]MBA2676027.1 Rieske 2Fe-2S domain-containing protein [Ramlibacter sp.]
MSAAGNNERVIDGRRYLAIEHRGRPLLIAAVCPHKAAPMREATIDGDYIVCSHHCATFDLRTGAWVRGPKCGDLAIRCPEASTAAA